MDASLTAQFLEVAYPVISAASLAACRAMGVVVITPAFNRLGLTGMIRGCVAVAISIPMFFPVFDALTHMPEHGSVFIAGLLIKEFLIGILIGCCSAFRSGRRKWRGSWSTCNAARPWRNWWTRSPPGNRA